MNRLTDKSNKKGKITTMLKVESTNQVFYVEGETYPINPETDKISEHPCEIYQGQSFYSVDDAVREMHRVATETARWYRNRKYCVTQRSKRKYLTTTLKTSDGFYTVYNVTYRKDDFTKRVIVNTREHAKKLLEENNQLYKCTE